MQKTLDAAIIGGGIVGLAMAHELVAAGMRRVAVFESRLAGSGSTFNGSGGVRSQFAHPLNVALSLRMQTILSEWEDRFGVDPDYQKNGYLYLGTKPEHVVARDGLAQVASSAGANVRRIGATDVAEIVPGMRTEGILAAWYTPDDGVLSPHIVFGSLRRSCLRVGVAIEECRSVEVSMERGRATGVHDAGQNWSAETVIVAAGPATRAIVGKCGVTLPISPQRGQVFGMAVPAALACRTPLVFDMGTLGYFVTTRQGMLIGGSDREQGSDFDPRDAERIVGLLDHRIPGISASAVTSGHVGVRASSPDMLGILGAVPGIDGLYVAGGFGHTGFMHAMPAAELLVDRICGRKSTIDATALDPARFAASADIPAR